MDEKLNRQKHATRGRTDTEFGEPLPKIMNFSLWKVNEGCKKKTEYTLTFYEIR